MSVGATSLPGPATYVDPDHYETERRAVFARQWTAVGTASRLADPGAYLAVWVAGYPLVVVDHGGTLWAFHNICRHLSGPLVDAGSGRSSHLVCRYHGWAHTLDGRRSAARDFGVEVDGDDLAPVRPPGGHVAGAAPGGSRTRRGVAVAIPGPGPTGRAQPHHEAGVALVQALVADALERR